jgi:hypothetical protein
MFSGGSYAEVARWLWNFLTSHAKREHPRLEVVVETGDEREGKSYATHLVFGGRRAPFIELDYREVADRRGDLEWCRAMATRVQAAARALVDGG